MKPLLILILLVSPRSTDGRRSNQKPILHTATDSNNTTSKESPFAVEPFESRATVDVRSNSSIMEPSNTSSTAHLKTAFPSRSITKTIKLGFHFFLWYFFTVVYNVSNKRVLNDLPLPATVAVIQIILGIPVFLPVWLFKRPNFESCRAIIPSICKIGFVHALGNLATVISLSQGSVSFTHIIKAAEPIFSAGLSALIFGDFASTSVYLTLIPIVAGVAISSVKELSFTWTGFLAGMASNLFYQLRIVLSKKEFTGDAKAVSPSNFFRLLTIVSALELLPISIALEGYRVRSAWEAAVTAGVNTDALMSNLLISGFSYYCYNEVSFWILGSISPMTHAVGNTVKRVAIILASILILKSPISDYGIMGSTMAVLGTFAYAMASHHSTKKVLK
jgi:solute carrier family 35, member E1